jgi:hypothetical protein
MAKLYDAICTVDRFPGCLHVPVIHHHGKWLNAVTGHVEPWVKSAEPMTSDRARMFELGAAAIINRLGGGKS